MPPADRNLRATVQGRIGLGRAEPPITGIASTAEERSAIAQLRHAVYVAELNKSPSSTADDALGELRDPEDEREGSYLHYVRVGEEVVGTLRSDLYQPGSAGLRIVFINFPIGGSL